jgi:hypothetical protein
MWAKIVTTVECSHGKGQHDGGAATVPPMVALLEQVGTPLEQAGVRC